MKHTRPQDFQMLVINAPNPHTDCNPTHKHRTTKLYLTKLTLRIMFIKHNNDHKDDHKKRQIFNYLVHQ